MIFIIAQILAVFAFIISTIAIQFKEKKNIIMSKAIANFLYAIQYLLLGSITAFLTNLVGAVRNVWFNYNDSKKHQENIYVLLFFFAIAIIIGIFTYQNVFSLLPIIAMIIHAYLAWQQKAKVIRYGTALVIIIWIAYNIYIMAYVALLTTLVNLISTIVAIYRYDIKKQYLDKTRN